jgi:energy-coupling factor transporter transmembrane protein EcfT
MKPRITYQPGTSLLHRLHPLVKAAWLLSGTVAVFVVRSPWPVMVLVGLLLLAFPLAGVRLTQVRGMRLFFTTALLLAILQFLFVDQGGPVPDWPADHTTGGVQSRLCGRALERGAAQLPVCLDHRAE